MELIWHESVEMGSNSSRVIISLSYIVTSSLGAWGLSLRLRIIYIESFIDNFSFKMEIHSDQVDGAKT